MNNSLEDAITRINETFNSKWLGNLGVSLFNSKIAVAKFMALPHKFTQHEFETRQAAINFIHEKINEKNPIERVELVDDGNGVIYKYYTKV